MRKHFPLLLIVLVYLLMGTLFAIFTPDWEAPDEPAHYNYVRQLGTGQLPVIEPGDYDQAYIVEVVFESHFDPAYSLDSMEYEDWQPPLYYLLLTPIYWLTGGSLLALRLTSLLIGAGIVVLAFLIGQQVTGRAWMGWITAVFIAFLPQHIAILSSLNNDALAELLIAAILWFLVNMEAKKRMTDYQFLITDTSRYWFTIGLLLGLVFLTKGTAYLMAPVIGLALLWHFWGDWRGLWQASWRIALPALLLGALWWGRNIAIYGSFDVLGKAAHDAVVVGQPRTADWITQFGLWGTIKLFLQTTFNSFWGQFGWMTVPMPAWVYRPLLLFTGIVVMGVLVSGWQKNPNAPHFTPQAKLILISTFLLAAGLHIGYNLTFVQHQGRYLFPALIPIGIGVAVGLGVWIRPFSPRWPIMQTLLPWGLGLALAALDILALFRFIVPTLVG
jgi:4-amino-4-deoxy-L-arabinose transferase-like glycosyltransferase